MIKTEVKELCCGCGTCELVCPKKCISFNEDVIGARYPIININECVNCGKCESVCPIQNYPKDATVGLQVFAAYSKNPEVRYRGSSGGMFETISDYVIRQGGSVFGSKFDDNLKLKCFEAKNLLEVQQMTKSKYLQSDCSNMFPVIKQRIEDGITVLFCSTPCQINAFKKYIGQLSKKENLFLIDFFCHGVPSQSFFDKCIDFIEKKNNIQVVNYYFRTKIKKGATPHYYTLLYEKNGVKHKKISLYYKDPFYLGFQKYITLRDSCYDCMYGYGNHGGDITIGDFHDIDKYVTGINRFDGVSTIIINTNQGKKLWEKISNELIYQELNINKLLEDKIIYSGGSKKPAFREEFIDDMRDQDFSFVVNKWLNSKKEWKKGIYYNLPAIIRKYLKRMVGL